MRGSFRKLLGNFKCVEVGVGGGDNAEVMMRSLPLAKFYLVDSYNVNNPTFQFCGKVFTDQERQEFIDKVKTKLEPFKDRYEFLIEDSGQASTRFDNESLDYVYIDAEHDYKSVLRDILFWYPKVRKGGVLGGHDFGEDVAQAVNDALISFGYKTLETGYAADWWIVKK